MSNLQTIKTLDLIQNFFQALAKRELQTILGFFAEEVDWDVPGNEELAPWLGKRKNRNDIKAFYQLLWQGAEPISAQVEHILTDGNFGVATGQFSSRMLRSGQVYSSIFSAHFTLKEGKIIHYRFLEDSHGLVEALCLPMPSRPVEL